MTEAELAVAESRFNDSGVRALIDAITRGIYLLEKFGYNEKTLFRAKFICPDLVERAWELWDKIDIELAPRRPFMVLKESRDGFIEEIIKPWFLAWIDVVKAVYVPKKK